MHDGFKRLREHFAGPDPVEPEVLEAGKRVYKIDSTPPDALVIHCADPRFQTAFRRFVTEELGIRNYIPLVIGGSVHAFGLSDFLPKNVKVLWEQIKFFVEQFHIRRVIIINHEDCRWYHSMSTFYSKVKPRQKGKLDLVTTARMLLEDFGGIEVRSFWADLDGDAITFSEVTSDAAG